MAEYRIVRVGAADPLIEVHPGWGLRERHSLGAATHRGRHGALHIARWGLTFRVELPLQHLSQAVRDALISWWRAQARLAWVRQDGTAFETHVVYAGDSASPISRRQPYTADLHSGALALLGIHAGVAPVRGAPLILDHATFGTLDTHNLLL